MADILASRKSTHYSRVLRFISALSSLRLRCNEIRSGKSPLHYNLRPSNIMVKLEAVCYTVNINLCIELVSDKRRQIHRLFGQNYDEIMPNINELELTSISKSSSFSWNF